MHISFLAPVWNEESHLSEMIDSLLVQSNPNWQLVIVDDGSTDRTLEIAMNYATLDDRIVIAGSGRKIGKVPAFNLAFRNSDGNLIAISGGDDIHAPNSVEDRLRALSPHADEAAAAYFKLYMFSTEARFDGAVLPRGRRGSRSGPCLTLTRPLAQTLFPIPEWLASEDIWLGEASEDLAKVVLEEPQVVVHYRVHAGNSNPRSKPFAEMSRAMSARAAAWQVLLDSRLPLSQQKRSELLLKRRAEVARAHGKVLRILALRDMPVIDRLGTCAMANPRLWRLRTRFYKHLSGWRGR